MKVYIDKTMFGVLIARECSGCGRQIRFEKMWLVSKVTTPPEWITICRECACCREEVEAIIREDGYEAINI